MQRVRRQPAGQEQRASFAELFFDLVFVVVVTQLSTLLLHHLTLKGAAETLFLLLVAWWAWIYTTWTTNWFDPDSPVVRAVLLVGMLASMFGAIAIPDAFGDRALLLVGGYVAVQTFRNAFMVIATGRDDPLHAALVRILVWNAWVGAIWLTGALVDDVTRVWVWIVALVLDYAGPLLGHWTPGRGRTQPNEWELEPSHFVERVELFLIIALGESIVATSLTASHLPLTATRLLAVTVGFFITGALWWLYFHQHAERTLSELRAAAGERGRVGRRLSYLHVPLIAGIIVTAVANELVIAHPGRELGGAQLAALVGGPALYLLGSVAFKRWVLRIRSIKRLVATLLVAGVGVLGTVLPALAAWTLVLAILAGVAALEVVEQRG
jgi:low temperature requirement protein LtrA